MWPCKKVSKEGQHFWGTTDGSYIENISKIRNIESTCAWYVAEKYWDRQTNLSDDSNFNNGITEKTNLFQRKISYENQSSNLKVTAEHLLKKIYRRNV